MQSDHNIDLSTIRERGDRFPGLHAGSQAFIVPNPWDVGTARVLESLGFTALATTSAGYAFSMGARDGAVARDDMLAHVAAIAAAVSVPVSADLEDGYGESPSDVAETISEVGRLGAVGASIEDRPSDTGNGSLFDIEVAVDRVRAASDAARSHDFGFTLTARCENYLVGNPDLSATIARLQAYQEAGADVLYAPGLTTRDEIEMLVKSVDRPVNVVVGLSGSDLTLQDLSEMGVRRVSVGSALARAAWTAFLDAAQEMQRTGTFGFAGSAMSHGEMNLMFPTPTGL